MRAPRAYGVYQIGELYARSWITEGCPVWLGSIPSAIASDNVCLGVGIWITRR